jgi:5-methylcytosine-specific restriction endonuclease McrA
MTWPTGKARRQARGQNNQRLHHRVLQEQRVCGCGGCVACTYDGTSARLTEGERCNAASTEVDHVVAFSEGGTDDRSNLRGLCHWCHAQKTSDEALRGKARKRGVGREQHPGLL